MASTRLSDTLGFWTVLGGVAVAAAGLAADLLGLIPGPYKVVAVVSGVFLVFGLPVAALLLWEWASTGSIPLLSLKQLVWNLLPFLYDWQFAREVASREDIDPDEFYRRYYQGTDVPEPVVLRLLPMYSGFLGVPPSKLRPQDWPPQLAEYDTEPLLSEIEHEFGIPAAKWDVDGTFDSVVRYLTRRITETGQRGHISQWQRALQCPKCTPSARRKGEPYALSHCLLYRRPDHRRRRLVR